MKLHFSYVTFGRCQAYQLSAGIGCRGDPIASKYSMEASLYAIQRESKKPEPGFTPCERSKGCPLSIQAKSTRSKICLARALISRSAEKYSPAVRTPASNHAVSTLEISEFSFR